MLAMAMLMIHFPQNRKKGVNFFRLTVLSSFVFYAKLEQKYALNKQDTDRHQCEISIFVTNGI